MTKRSGRQAWGRMGVAAALCMAAVAGAHAAQGQGAASAPAQAPAERVRAAQQRALFASDEPLPITLVADFKAVNRDRNPSSTKTFPATLIVPGLKGGEDRIEVKIRTRGHARRLTATCTFAPLRIEFIGNVEGTMFDGNKSLKLGTHCRDADSYEQYVYREYGAYRILNFLTPRSFRARLASARYVDAGNGKPIATRAALFLEDDDDVARRMDGRSVEAPGLTFARVDSETVTLLTLFEYMIGNTDMSLAKQHNIKVVRTPDGLLYPVPYDFDYSGLVNARYAIPTASLNIATVRERLYRGPCRTAEQFAPLFARLSATRPAVMALYDNMPGLDAGYRKDARNYLDQFYRTIEKPGDVKKIFIDTCSGRSRM